MAILTRDRLEPLLQAKAGPCVSLYMPTHRHHPGTEQDPIRFKNALKEAERLLSDRHSAREIRALLDPMVSVSNLAFWRHQGDGLAMLRSAEVLQEFRLPMSVPDLVVVAESFHVRPLLRCLHSNERYFVLALSRNDIAVYQGSMTSLTRMEIPQLPGSLSEFPGARRQKSTLTAHATASGGAVRRMHGAGGTEPSIEVDLVPYFRAIDRALGKALRNDGAPVILAGVEYYLPIYRRITRLKQFADAIIPGSPDAMTESELQDRAWPIAQRLLRQGEERALADYRRAAERGRSSTKLEDVARLARRGKVRRLILPLGVRIWGTTDPDSGEIHRMPGQQGSLDDDILDDVAEAVYRAGGEVITVPREQMPDGEEVAAELRSPRAL